MAAVSESRVSDLDGFWFSPPSKHTDNKDHSDEDSDYETDNEYVASSVVETVANVQWTGYAKRIPVMLFSVDAVYNRISHFRTIAEQYNLTFKFASTDCKVVRKILLSHGFQEAKPGSTEYNLLWSNAHLKPSTLRFMADFQKINHFPRSYELTRKDRLFRNIQRMQLMKGHRNFDFIPASYVLPGDCQEFYTHFQKHKGMYIVKPVASSQGRGVFLVNHPEQVPLDENVIVSKYISAPLVIDGFKFDVRCYVAVTSYDPLVIYMYEEGLTRFATVKYEKDMRYLQNLCMHLTNYSVNKRSQYYVRNADPNIENFGNKWSMSAMLRHLRSRGKDTVALMMQIENIVIKTILSVESSIVAACKMYEPFRNNCYEMYGFDILIDEHLKPWVLEVNFSPSLACDTPLDLKIKSNMLCDLFSLVGVVCQDPSTKRRLRANRQRKFMDKTPGQLATSRLPVRSTSEEQDENTHMGGLNSEEIKILRRVKEEESRKGGWIRIFPNADSWDIYGHLLPFPNAHNIMLHQRLYPDRNKGTSSGKTASIATGKQTLSKNKIQAPLGRHGKDGQEIDISISVSVSSHRPQKECLSSVHELRSTSEDPNKDGEKSASGLIRVKQYERKLKQLKISQLDFNTKDSTIANIIHGNSEVEDSAENECEDSPVSHKLRVTRLEKSKPQLIDSAIANIIHGNSKVEDSAENECEDSPVSHKLRVTRLDKSEPQLIDVLPGKPVTKAEKSPPGSSTSSSNASVEGSAVDRTHPEREPLSLGEPHQFSYRYLTMSKTDLLSLFQNGYTLSTVQARTAFAMYLVRVQERLLSDWSTTILHRGTNAASDQIELVLRFLKYAVANLKQTLHSVVVPSKKLPIQNRKKILAEQLGIFIGLYNKETEEMKMRNIRMRSENRKQKRSESCKGLCEHDFAEFVSVAKEDELEAVLMAYAKSNKSSTVFMGGDSSLEPDTELEDQDKQQTSGQALSHDLVTFGAMGDLPEVRESYLDSAPIIMNNNNSISLNANSLQAKVASRTVSQHGSVQHRHHTEQLGSETAVIYTQKIGRPLSSTSSGQSRAGNNKKGLLGKSESIPTSDTGSKRKTNWGQGSALTTRTGSHRSEASMGVSPNSLSTTSSSMIDTPNEKAIEDAIHHLTAKLQLLKASHSNISSQTPQAENLTAPHCGYDPSSTAGEASSGYTDVADVTRADMSSAKLPGSHHVTFEKCGDLNLLGRNMTNGRMADMIKPKHHFTLVGKSIKPLTNRKPTKRRIPETKSTLTTDHSARS